MIPHGLEDSEARAWATQIVSWAAQSGACSELRGPERIIGATGPRPGEWSLLLVANGVELWIDVKARPS